MISVCMGTYNGEKYIREQIDSILPQLAETDELIISDDGSTDRTCEIVESCDDPRINLLHGSFHSPIYNLENALRHAKGEQIYLADQDDVWMPDKVAVMQRYLQDHDCVVSDAVVVDAKRQVLYPSFRQLRHTGPGFVRNLLKNGYIGCCMAVNRRILDLALPFPKNIPMHDIWLGMIAEKYGRSVFLDEKLIEYRRHGDNASQTAEKSRYNLKEKIGFRTSVLRDLKQLRNRQNSGR